MVCILDLAPTYPGSSSYPFRDTEGFILKHSNFCAELLDREPSDPLHQEASARVHAAMRTIIVAVEARSHHSDNDALIWEWGLDWDDTHDPQRIL